MAIRKSDLSSSLWASCDELRGGRDASQYKDYVLFMLFIKYVSDKYGDSDDLAPPVVIPEGASFKDRVALKGKDDIGDKINTQVIQPLIDANSRLARSDFPDFNDSNKLGDGKDKVEKLGVTTAGFARMNMILHDFPTANVLSGNTLFDPKFKDGEALRTYDYVVANPPLSDKTWSTGLTLGEGGSGDRFQRFTWGMPPTKQGDYAYLLHIIRSLKNTGKGACILPHGVLFRGNAEAVIRQQLVRSGYLKAIIGLPANLFYGTGIPTCILVLDMENATARKGVFMIDASKGFKKDGPKNRIREQDLHKIVDTFTRQDESNPRDARMVPVAEIADPKNDYNLNLPRYIDSTEPEDLQDIDGHLRGGIPERDLDAPGAYWKIMPGLRAALFGKFNRPGYSALKLPIAEVKPAIFAHPEFTAFTTQARNLFTQWQTASVPRLKGLAQDGHPKPLIETIAEDLLATFKTAPLLDAYDVYQHLMDNWAMTMQDDCYLIADAGWKAGAKPREIVQIKNKEGKLVWPEKEDFKKGKRRLKSDLVPAALLIARYFATERDAIAALEADLASIEQQLDETREENSGEERLLAERYATPLPQLVDEVAELAARVDEHLKRMGAKP